MHGKSLIFIVSNSQHGAQQLTKNNVDYDNKTKIILNIN
jgi:hypothetical protein